MSRNIKTLPFALFIKRQKVLVLYRSLHRTARRIADADLRNSIREQIRSSFHINATLEDNTAIKACLTEANRSLAQIEALVESSSTSTDDQYTVGQDWPWARGPDRLL
jgi:primosomal protein N''